MNMSSVFSRPGLSHSHLSRSLFALALLASLNLPAYAAPKASAVTPTGNAPVTTGMSGEVPPPAVAARAFALLDMSTGQRLAAQDPDMRVEPASLTKLMTAYLTFNALREKQLTLEQTVAVSQRAWKATGSRMFIEPNKPVTVGELVRGMIIQSGNDASVALAEAIAGDETQFATLMNREANRLGMKNTQFRNATGLPDPQHYSTAQDLTLLASALVREHPDFYKFYSEREYTYNGIRQPNRNKLLVIDSTVDGMKTGYTENAGYCLVSSAKRTLPNGVDRRLVSVVLGAPSDNVRAQESLKLLNYGFQMFETVKLYGENQVVATPDIFKGVRPTLKTGFQRNVIISVPRGSAGKLQASFQKVDPLIAPIKAGQPVGQLQVTLDGKVLLETPMVALEDLDTSGLVGRLVDSGKLWWKARQSANTQTPAQAPAPAPAPAAAQ